jgi:hypothetical protein
MRAMSNVQENEPPRLKLWIELELDPSGTLSGWLRAKNLAHQSVRLSGKPDVVPLGEDGLALPVDCIVTAEMRIPHYVEIGPAQEARAPIGWGGRSGPHAGGEWQVQLDALSPKIRVEASGPREPTGRVPQRTPGRRGGKSRSRVMPGFDEEVVGLSRRYDSAASRRKGSPR